MPTTRKQSVTVQLSLAKVTKNFNRYEAPVGEYASIPNIYIDSTVCETFGLGDHITVTVEPT